jgi:hypothetical protein
MRTHQFEKMKNITKTEIWKKNEIDNQKIKLKLIIENKTKVDKN